MKKVLFTTLCTLLAVLIALPVSASSTLPAEPFSMMRTALIALCIVLGILLLGAIIFSVVYFRASLKSRGKLVLLCTLYIATVIVLACTLWAGNQYRTVQDSFLNNSSSAQNENSTIETSDYTEESTDESTSESTIETTEEIIPDPTLNPGAVEVSNPANWKMQWDIIVNGEFVDSYTRPETIDFGKAEDYSLLEGITTFRGDNYRSGATFGTATVTNKTLSTKWSSSIGSFNSWSGCGWTGQPIVVRWDDETKDIMNLYPAKKSKADLVEVIYATLDGNIYFYDMDDGSYTRDPIKIGMNFKGAGTLDPRGYPLLYVGAGDYVPSLNYSGKAPRMYIVSLIEGKVIYERSGVDSFARRGWYAMDSAPLVDAETDNLIWAAESGLIYTFKLNTNYDKAAKTISVDPEPIRARYKPNTGRNIGFESSIIAVGEYLYAGDNGGMFLCMNANTMDIVWAQDIHDDLNATPVFEWGEDGQGYLYLATSLQYSKGIGYVYKLNANTGEIVWEKTYKDIAYNKDVSGGALSSPLLGKAGTKMENMLIVHMARAGGYESGLLTAFNTETGEIIWEKRMSTYAWSSPVAVYADDGSAYIIICDAAGYMYLINAENGETLNKISLGSNIEASPVVFENTVVVGTRGQKVYGITIH